MEQEKRYRHELKYAISYPDYIAMRTRLKSVMRADPHVGEGTDLEKYLDVDNVLKYMAVHTFSVNMDSLLGSMAHNYYLYEYKGQLNLFPWDYNLSLGGMSMGSSGASYSAFSNTERRKSRIIL